MTLTSLLTSQVAAVKDTVSGKCKLPGTDGRACVMFGKRARRETLSIDSIDFVFSGACTNPTDNYGH